MTTIDTLDYSGEGLNEGSKLIIAAAGPKKRNLLKQKPLLKLSRKFTNICIVIDGVLAIDGNGSVEDLIQELENIHMDGIALITLVDDVFFVAEDFSNWLWVCFTRSNPSHDIYGLDEVLKNKHFSCSIPIIDARIKKHHAPVLER